MLPDWLSSIFSGIFSAIANAVSGFFQARAAVADNVREGETAQVAVDNAKAATVDAAIAKSEAQPVTETTVETRLNDGTF